MSKLTDEQIWQIYMAAPVDINCHVSDLHTFARAIEAELSRPETDEELRARFESKFAGEILLLQPVIVEKFFEAFKAGASR